MCPIIDIASSSDDLVEPLDVFWAYGVMLDRTQSLEGESLDLDIEFKGCGLESIDLVATQEE